MKKDKFGNIQQCDSRYTLLFDHQQHDSALMTKDWTSETVDHEIIGQYLLVL